MVVLSHGTVCSSSRCRFTNVQVSIGGVAITGDITVTITRSIGSSTVAFGWAQDIPAAPLFDGFAAWLRRERFELYLLWREAAPLPPRAPLAANALHDPSAPWARALRQWKS